MLQTNIRQVNFAHRSFLLVILLLLPFKLFSQETYSFGVVPQFGSKQIYANWKPLLLELEKRTKLKFTLIGSPGISEFETRYLAGQFDFAYMNPYHLIKSKDTAGYIPLVRDTARSLQGIIVVRKDSDIDSVEQLKDKTLTFPAENALGATLFIKSDLKDLYQINVGSKYVKTHSSVYLSVFQQFSSAGGGVLSTFNQQPKVIRDGLKILYKSRTVAPHPITVHPRVPPEIRIIVTKTLIDMGQDPNTKKLFDKIPIKQLGLATMADYEELKDWNLDHFYQPN